MNEREGRGFREEGGRRTTHEVADRPSKPRAWVNTEISIDLNERVDAKGNVFYMADPDLDATVNLQNCHFTVFVNDKDGQQRARLTITRSKDAPPRGG